MKRRKETNPEDFVLVEREVRYPSRFCLAAYCGASGDGWRWMYKYNGTLWGIFYNCKQYHWMIASYKGLNPMVVPETIRTGVANTPEERRSFVSLAENEPQTLIALHLIL